VDKDINPNIGLIQPIMNLKKVKYKIFQEMINKTFQGDITEVNIFIDVHSVLSNFYQSTLQDSFKNISVNEKYKICAELINIAAHYRHFFWSRYGIRTYFYYYYSDKEAEFNTSLNDTYRRDFYNKILYEDVNSEHYALNGIIKKNIKLAKLIIDYIPNVYFFNTKSFNYTVFPYFAISDMIDYSGNENYINLIMTNDTVQYQCCNLEKTYVMSMRSDNSKIIYEDELINSLLTKTKSKDKSSLDSSFYRIILAMSGYKKYNLEGKKGFGYSRSITALEKLIDSGKISNIPYSDIDIILDNIENLSDDDKGFIRNNFKMFDYETIKNSMTEKEYYNIMKQVKDINNWQSVMEVNEVYFKNSPLMTQELIEGV